MHRRLIALIAMLLILPVSLLWSSTASTKDKTGATVDYVYGNHISSISFDTLPKVGAEFKDSSNNVLIVSKIHENTVIFDKIRTHSPIVKGDKLFEKGQLHSIFVRASLHDAMVGYSLSTSMHPIKPIVLFGCMYNARRLFATIGFETEIILSNLWDTSFTFVEDGGVFGWCSVGAFLTPSFGYAFSYGGSYRHYVGAFRWEIGYSYLSGVNGLKCNKPFVGIGIAL